MKSKWRGPFKIKKIYNDGMNFVLKRGSLEIKTNIHKIKRYKPRQELQLEEDIDEYKQDQMDIESVQPNEPDLQFEVTPQPNNKSEQIINQDLIGIIDEDMEDDIESLTDIADVYEG